MSEDFRLKLESFTNKISDILGTKMISVVLYGSYARGDYRPDSDIDVLILADMSDDEIKNIENKVYDCAYDFELEYGKTLSPIIKNREFFDYWSDTLPFYINIKNEGVRVA